MVDLVDLSGNNPTIKLLSSPNRYNAGSPITSLVPEFPGELIGDTTNHLLWRAFGTTSGDWMPVGSFDPKPASGGSAPSLDSQERWIRATQGSNDPLVLPRTSDKFKRNGYMAVYKPELA